MRKVCIGIHVHEEPEQLRATLESVRRTTAPSVEVVLLPDGADRRMKEALGAWSGLTLLGTEEPRGVAACFNRLAAYGDADVVALLESGSRVSPHWLDILLAALDADPGHGLAGPSTNRAWNEQGVFARSGGTVAEVARTAQIARQRFGASWRTLEPLYSLADFCYVVKRAVIEAVGAADESYGLGPCWEMDYNVRAARAGFAGVWAGGAYVWRAPFSPRRQREEDARFAASRHLYQDKFCALRLTAQRAGYEAHCRGDACEHFAPSALIEAGVIHLSLPLTQSSMPPAAEPRELPASAVPIKLEVTPVSSAVTVTPALPLVSCIMPTANRPDFVRQAIRYFQQQDYANRELLIVDDEGADMAGTLPADARIRYVQMAAGRSIGAKRNYACELAQGEIIAQWDDDDWYAAGRLTAQVAPLLAGEAEISGLRTTLFFELSRWHFWGCTPELHRRMFEADVHGGTLVFRRQVWEQLARYPDRSLAEDAYFLRQALRRGARLSRLPNENLFIYLRHAKNSWAFTCGQFLSPKGWQRRGEPPFSPEERAFYRSHSPAATSSPIGMPVGGGGQARGPVPTDDDVGCGPLWPPASQTPPSMAAQKNGQTRGSVATDSGQATGPLVSCIMPTANRRHFVPHAIRYFLQQDYVNRELIIVDDGEEGVGDLIAADRRIRYVRLNKRHTIGAKRNIACEQARGEIVVHWDDDDWFAPWRLTYQVEALVKEGADICGLTTLLYHEPATGQTWRYLYPAGQRAWVTGNTLCYPRSVWKRSSFANINVGEDTRFVWSGQARRIFALPRHDFYVAMLHAGNTSAKSCRGPYWSRWEGDLGAIMGGDLQLYQTDQRLPIAK